MIAIMYIIAKLANMVVLTFLLDKFMSLGIILLIVVFQPELRNIFEKLGRSKVVDVFDMDDNILVKMVNIIWVSFYIIGVDEEKGIYPIFL